MTSKPSTSIPGNRWFERTHFPSGRSAIRTLVAVRLVAPLSCDRKCNPDDSSFGPSQLDAALTLTVDSTSIPADGFSRTRVVARLAAGTDADKRTVRFTTTGGTLLGPTRWSVDVPADSAGIGIIQLESDRSLQTAVVRHCRSCHQTDCGRLRRDYTSEHPDDRRSCLVDAGG